MEGHPSNIKKKNGGGQLGKKAEMGIHASSALVSLGVTSDWNTYLQRTELTAQK